MALKDSYFTVAQAAEELGVTRKTISRWLADGKLSAEKVGREKLIPRVDVAYMERSSHAGYLAPAFWGVIRRFLGEQPKHVDAEGIIGQDPLEATVIDRSGKTRFIELLHVKNDKGGIIDFKCHEVDKFAPYTRDTTKRLIKVDAKIHMSEDNRFKVQYTYEEMEGPEVDTGKNDKTIK